MRNDSPDVTYPEDTACHTGARASGSRILAAVALAAGAVAAGAALGFSTARFTMNRREGGAEETTFITVRPAEGGGVTIAFAMPLR